MAEPTTSTRFEVVDMLRGFALGGILMINLVAFKAPGGPPGLGFNGELADRLVLGGLIMLVESKFFTLFSLLFGLGFAIQLDRAAQRGEAFLPRFLRRLLGLLLFGVLHVALLWEGDILIIYALVGLLLLPFRGVSQRRLLSWAVWLLLVPAGLAALGLGALEIARRLPGAGLAELDAELLRLFATERAVAVERLAAGSYGELLQARVAAYLGTAVLLISRIPTVLAMFLLGLYVGRAGIAARPVEHQALLRRARRLGLGLGLPISLAVALAYNLLPPTSGLIALFLNQYLAGPILAVGYGASVVLLAGRPGWMARLRPLGAVGQLALTNYLLQSLVASLLMAGYGLGLVGQVSPRGILGLWAAIFTAQLLLSRWWLRGFQFGPLEWLWRSLTYLRLPPLRRGGRPSS